MPDLSELLHNTATDDIIEVEVPPGYWEGKILSGKLYDTNNEGEPLTDKNGNVYARAVLYISCTEPLEGVSSAEAEVYAKNNGPDATRVRYNAFVRTGRDIKRLSGLLAEMGAVTTGRSLADQLDGLKGVGVPCRVLVEIEEYNGEPRREVTEIVALRA